MGKKWPKVSTLLVSSGLMWQKPWFAEVTCGKWIISHYEKCQVQWSLFGKCSQTCVYTLWLCKTLHTGMHNFPYLWRINEERTKSWLIFYDKWAVGVMTMQVDHRPQLHRSPYHIIFALPFQFFLCVWEPQNLWKQATCQGFAVLHEWQNKF